MSCTFKPAISLVLLVSGCSFFFDRFQLTISWMSTIKLNAEGTCLGHLVNSARSLQGNLARSAANQSVRTTLS